VKRTFLEGSPNGVTDRLLFATQTRIPKPENSDAAGFQPRIACSVASDLAWHPVLESVQLDIHPRFHTREVQDVPQCRYESDK
jgi:hypothetical protein